MIKIRRLKKALKLIDEIWGEHDTLNNWIGVIWCVRKQLEEIEEGQYRGDVVLKEVADILIILVRYLDKIGIDPEKLMIHRLETRHKGKIKEIVAKYAKKWNEELKNNKTMAAYATELTEDCRNKCTPFCTDYDTCLIRRSKEDD